MLCTLPIRSSLPSVFSFLLLQTAGVMVSPAQAEPTKQELEVQRLEVASWLLGTMDSSLQAIDDPSYFDVTLRHCEVLVEGAQLPQEYLLVLQSISTAAAPYRVRVTQVQTDVGTGSVTSTNFLLAEGMDATSLCDKPLSERVIKKSDLVVNRCTTYLRKVGDIYAGGTLAEGCPSAINGAVRVTSDVELGPDHLSSWDRGWKEDGTQAWGAVKGPYQFRRTSLEKQDALLAQLAAFLAGRLDNAEQVADDPVNFSPVAYQICPVVGPGFEAPEVRLLLARQFITVPGNTLSRNRIYRLERLDGSGSRGGDVRTSGQFAVSASPFDESRVDPSLCDRPLSERLAIETSSIEWDSCILEFSYDATGLVYTGGTPEGGCPSSFRGSVKLEITETIGDGFVSPWERWYNAAGNQVAGSTAGPYIYKRIRPE